MFEGGLSVILNRLLSEFIEEGCFDDNVQVAVWSGYVVLENLVLKIIPISQIEDGLLTTLMIFYF